MRLLWVIGKGRRRRTNWPRSYTQRARECKLDWPYGLRYGTRKLQDQGIAIPQSNYPIQKLPAKARKSSPTKKRSVANGSLISLTSNSPESRVEAAESTEDAGPTINAMGTTRIVQEIPVADDPFCDLKESCLRVCPS